MAPSPKYCLLVVDDEPDVCDSVQHLLRREYRAATLAFEELYRGNPTFAYAVVAGACRHVPRSLLGAYRLMSVLRLAVARP